MSFQFEMATRLHFGPGRLSILAQEADSFGIKSWLLATDAGLNRLGMGERIKEMLSGAGFKLAVYAGVDSEPTDKHVAEGLAVYRDNACQGVIALGGGSAIDAGKAIAVMATNKGRVSDYHGFDKIKTAKAPLIAIPTTAGTGSEVTRAAGITDTQRNIKMVLIAPTVAPEVAIDDPELTVSLPPSVTAHTGIDALSHAIEAFVSRQGNPISATLSLQAMRIITGQIIPAWEKGTDIEARSAMMLGQFMAGMAVMNAQVCLVHGMSRPLGAYFHIPHGMGNAMLLPVVMRFNVEAMEDPALYAEMAEALAESVGGPNAEAAELTASGGLPPAAAVERVQQLCRKLKIPRLKDLEIDRNTYDGLLDRMAEDCLASGSPGNNPIIPTKEQVVELYRILWEA